MSGILIIKMKFSLNILIFIITIILFNQLKEILGKLYSDDPDIYADLPALIISRGFKYEWYSVTTRDDYILTMFRIVNPFIPRPMLKPKPVILWHGINSNGEIWVKNRKGRLNNRGVYSEDNNTVVNDCKWELTATVTLGFTLSACGYDVWLPNSRGTQYSNKHVNFTTKDSKYWAFSMNEEGIYDVPATINSILQITNKKSLSLIAHSMGTTITFIMLTMRPEYQECVQPFIALAPVVFLNNTRTAPSILAPIEPLLRNVMPFGLGLPTYAREFIGAFICGNTFLNEVCLFIIDIIAGRDRFNIDRARVPTIFPDLLDYTSLRVALQYAQFVNTGHFAAFNYGEDKNNEVYGQEKPPNFPLERITSTDIYLFNGLNDLIATPPDVKRIYNTLPGTRYLKTNPWPLWNHQDFTSGKLQSKFQDAAILKILRSYN